MSIPSLGLINTTNARRDPLPRVPPRGVPAAFVGHERPCPNGLSDVAAFFTGFLGTARVTSTEAVPPSASIGVVDLPGISLAHVEFDASVFIEVPVTSDHVAVIVHTHGTSNGRVDAERVNANPTRAMVTSPGRHLNIEFPARGSLLIVRIDRRVLEDSLSKMLGRRITHTIAFAPSLDLTADAAVRWTIAIQLVSAEMMSSTSLLGHGVGLAHLQDLLSSTLLLLQPSNYSDELAAGGGNKDRVRIATDYIERHLAEPLSTARIARAVHIGPRTLQQLFRDAFDETPTEYIRSSRLERVRRDLLGASAGDGTSVTAVAQRWGIAHLGEFAAQYRRRFGEPPSRTLRGP